MYENLELFSPMSSHLAATPVKSSGQLSGGPQGIGMQDTEKP